VTGRRRRVSATRTRLGTRLAYLRASGRLRRRTLWGLGTLLLLGVGWILVTGYLARQQADKLEDRLQRVQSLVAAGRLDEARQSAAGISTSAERAHQLTTGPAWWLGAQVPYFGRPLQVVRGMMAAGADVGTHGVPALMRVAPAVDPARLRTSGRTIDPAPLTAAAPQLADAADTLDAATRQIDRLPRNTWLDVVDGPRTTLAARLHSINGYVTAASRAARILPGMLGQHGTKRYFLGLQNEAELRGTGGLPGAFAIVEVRHGTVRFTHFESDAALLPSATNKLIHTGLDFGPGYRSAYGASAPTSFIVNSNMSPHFPYAARVWASMWEQVSGEHVDGAVAVDPTALGYLLSVTGPVPLPDGTPLAASDVVPLTERDEYALFSDDVARKAYLVSILRSAARQFTSGSGSATQFAQALSLASTEGRLLVWSSDPKAESVLARTNYGGVIPRTDRPFVGMVLNNTASGKLDYYLTRTLDYHRSGCDARRDVLVTMTLTNHAPAAGLPPYVNTRLDKHDYLVAPGDNRTLLDYYATAGAQLLSVSLNGKPTTATVEHDRGHPIFRLDLELPRATTQTVVLHLREPAGDGAPQIWRQPGVSPLGVTLFNQPC
jgi:uncharacterized protein DUF4012